MTILKHLFILSALSVFVAFSCDKPAENTIDIPTEDGFIPIVGESQTNYRIIYATGLQSASQSFASNIKSLTGVQMAVTAASGASETPYEILVGPVDREAVTSALQGIPHGYVVSVSDKRIIIAGTDRTWTILGLEAFAKRVFKDGTLCTENSLKVPEDLNLQESRKDPQMIARFLSANRPFTISTKLAGTCPQKDIYKVAQGAASDGKYVYFVMKGNEDSSNNSQCVVYKYTLNPFKYVAVSDEFNGHHANDMTFDSRNNRVLVVNGSGASSQLTALDANTLAISTIKTSLGIGGMTYNSNRNIYGITQGGTKYQTADESFKLLYNFGRSDKFGYTAQGMGSDDSYVYFPMSPNSTSSDRNVNILVTYDWDGKYKDNISIPLSMESESMFYAAGEYYVNFYSGGAKLYKITPEINYIATAR